MEAFLRSLITHRPFVIQRDQFSSMTQKVEELLGSAKIEAIHADQLWMAQYALQAVDGLLDKNQIRTVLDEHNACYQIFKRLAKGENNPLKKLILEREWRILKDFEASSLRCFDNIVTVTAEDHTTLAELGIPKLKTGYSPVIPICVDPHEFPPVASQPESNKTFEIVHLGTMFWLPNMEGVLWFVNKVWPLVLNEIPQAHFTIIGKKPPVDIQKIPERYPSISVTGFVREPQPYLERAAAFIVPLLSGSGMRVKILDAWRWGIPVVSTTIGAEGISVRPGENIMIADDPQGFAEAVISLLRQPLTRQLLRQNGLRWVEEHYDWQTVYPAWDTIYG